MSATAVIGFIKDIKAHNLKAVRERLAKGKEKPTLRFTDPAAANSDYTLLHKAVQVACLPIVEELLRAGADVDGRDTDAATPLHWVCTCAGVCGGEEETFLAIAAALFAAKADVRARDSKGATPLHAAATKSPALIQVLLRAGADAGDVDGAGRSALHTAAAAGRLESLQQLVAAGAPLARQDAAGWTPLMLLLWHGHTPQALQLLAAEGADACAVNAQEAAGGRTALALVCGVADGDAPQPQQPVQPPRQLPPGPDPAVVEALLAAGALADVRLASGDPLLTAVVRSGWAELAMRLLQACRDVAAKGAGGETALSLVLAALKREPCNTAAAEAAAAPGAAGPDSAAASSSVAAPAVPDPERVSPTAAAGGDAADTSGISTGSRSSSSSSSSSSCSSCSGTGGSGGGGGGGDAAASSSSGVGGSRSGGGSLPGSAAFAKVGTVSSTVAGKGPATKGAPAKSGAAAGRAVASPAPGALARSGRPSIRDSGSALSKAKVVSTPTAAATGWIAAAAAAAAPINTSCSTTPRRSMGSVSSAGSGRVTAQAAAGASPQRHTAAAPPSSAGAKVVAAAGSQRVSRSSSDRVPAATPAARAEPAAAQAVGKGPATPPRSATGSCSQGEPRPWSREDAELMMAALLRRGAALRPDEGQALFAEWWAARKDELCALVVPALPAAVLASLRLSYDKCAADGMPATAVAVLVRSSAEAGLDWRGPQDAAGNTHAMLAAVAPGDGSGPLLRALVAAGAPVDAADLNGDTALMLAARADALGACRALVAAGADLLHRNLKNRTPASQLKLEPEVRRFLAEAEAAQREARAGRDKLWDAKLAATQTASACILRSV